MKGPIGGNFIRRTILSGKPARRSAVSPIGMNM
jgi:hypothetical protein